jgi:hypothetical protein
VRIRGEVRSVHDKIATMSNRKLVVLARELRKNQTDAVILVGWVEGG